MNIDERLRLGEPLMMLIGSCEGIHFALKHTEFKAVVENLLERAKEMQKTWDKVTSSKGSGVK